jgi:hypothetical protein
MSVEPSPSSISSAPDSAPDVTGETLAPASALRIPLLVALVLAAAAALVFRQPIANAVRAGELPPWTVLAAPAAFALVVALGALDAWRTARRRGFFSGKSLVALFAAVAFMGVLVPDPLAEYRARTEPPASSPAHYAALLTSKDARVRALVMEVLAYKPMPGDDVAALLKVGLADTDPLVQAAAKDAVARRTGTPVASVQDAEQALAALRP